MACKKTARWRARHRQWTQQAVERLVQHQVAGKKKAARIWQLLEGQHRNPDSLSSLQQQAFDPDPRTGVVYVIFDNRWRFYIGSTFRLPPLRWTEHEDRRRKGEKYRGCRKLYFFVVRYGPIEDMKAVECHLISSYRPTLENKVHNFCEAPMSLPAEIAEEDEAICLPCTTYRAAGAKSRKRRRPRKREREADQEKQQQLVVATSHILELRKTRRFAVRQQVRKASFDELYQMFARKVPAPLNIYQPQNYQLLIKWLTFVDRRRRDKKRPHDLDTAYLRLHARPGCYFPEYEILRLASGNLSNMIRARVRRKVKFAMNLGGLPNNERARVYWRHEVERRALVRAFRIALASSQPECRRFLLRTIAFVQLPRPRLRDLLLQSVQAARKARVKGKKPREPHYELIRHNGTGALSGVMPPVDSKFLTEQLLQLRRLCKRRNAVLGPKVLEAMRDAAVLGTPASRKEFEIFASIRPRGSSVPAVDDKGRNNFYTMPVEEFENILVLAANSDMIEIDEGAPTVIARVNEALTALPIPLRPITSLPYFYPSVKNKCVKDGVLVCKKPLASGHSHFRKIISMVLAITGKNKRDLRKVNKECETMIDLGFTHYECNDLAGAKDCVLEKYRRLCEEGERRQDEFDFCRCIRCGCTKPKVALAVEDATSFFEKIPHANFFEACDNLQQRVEQLDYVPRSFPEKTTADVLGTLRGVVPALRYFQCGADAVYALPEGVGSVIGGINSKIVASIALCSNENEFVEAGSEAPLTMQLRYVDDAFGLSFTLCTTCLAEYIRSIYKVPFEPAGCSYERIEWLDMMLLVGPPTGGLFPELSVRHHAKDTARPPLRFDFEYGKSAFTAVVSRVVQTNSDERSLFDQLAEQISSWLTTFPARILRTYIASVPSLAQQRTVRVFAQLLRTMSEERKPWKGRGKGGQGFGSGRFNYSDFKEMKLRCEYEEYKEEQAEKKKEEKRKEGLLEVAAILRTGIWPTTGTTSATTTTPSNPPAAAPAAAAQPPTATDARLAALEEDVKKLKSFQVSTECWQMRQDAKLDNLTDLVKQLVPTDGNSNNQNNHNSGTGAGNANKSTKPPCKIHQDDFCDKAAMTELMTGVTIEQVKWYDNDATAEEKMNMIAFSRLKAMYDELDQTLADTTEARLRRDGRGDVADFAVNNADKRKVIVFILECYRWQQNP